MKVYSELEKASLENLASDPSPAASGQVYYNTTTGRVMLYKSGQWIDVTTDPVINLIDCGGP